MKSSTGSGRPLQDLVDELVRRGETLATAESLTGGRLAFRITAVPGVSQAYVGGVVSYATEIKQRLLGVTDDLVATHGVVSAECARAMAEGARDRLGATYALATTGVAGPDSQEDKPPGTVFVGVAGPGSPVVIALELSGDRSAIQERSCDEALAALRDVLQREEPGLR